MSVMTDKKRDSLKKLLVTIREAHEICMSAPEKFNQYCDYDSRILHDEQVRQILSNIEVAAKMLYRISAELASI